jgi:hypothetical protein
MLSYVLIMTEMLIKDKMHNGSSSREIRFLPFGGRMMNMNNGSIDVAIMSQLYREPVKVIDLRKDIPPSKWKEVMAALRRLLGKSLVKKINKDRAEPIYSLTRAGERVLLDLVAQRLAHGTPMA